MSDIFRINEELAAVAVTSTELHSISNTVHHYLKKSDFIRDFGNIICEINKSYFVLTESFSDFYTINSEDIFSNAFNATHQAFKDAYLLEINKPRKYCDNVYELYREMLLRKEAKTSFPPLKNNFTRLNNLYEKWIDNDAYLAMSIDRVLKLKNNWLTEIYEMKKIDEEDAYLIFRSSLNDFFHYLNITENNATKINILFENSQ